MGKVCLVTGGARSGKSRFAEKLAKEKNESVLYIATSIVFDEEMQERVRKHRQQRPSSWETHEGYKDLTPVIHQAKGKQDGILLDCVTIMMTNLLFDYVGNIFDDTEKIMNVNEVISNEELQKVEEKILEEFQMLLDALENSNIYAILVTNEIGFGVVPETILGRVFRDIAGRVNQYIASRADEVYLVICGVELKIK